MSELKLVAEETRGAGDVLATWLPRVAVALGVVVLGCTMVGAVIANIFILHTGLAAIIPAALFGVVTFVGVRSVTASR
jgi:hypothetical protein